MSNEEQTEKKLTEKKLTATQRLENLESALMQAYQTMNNIAQDLLTAKEAIKLLGNKADSIQKAAGFSDEQIASLMVENNVGELKTKVDNLLAQGLIQASETVSDTSFVVGKELEDDGKVVNPRLQFAVQALVQEVREKLVGAKSGDVIKFQEGKLSFEIQEVYALVTAQESEPTEAAPETAAQ